MYNPVTFRTDEPKCDVYFLLFQRWEILVLSKLKWDVASVTPQDFLRHLLGRLPVESVGIEYSMVNNHAKTLIALCARGMYPFMYVV